MTITPATEMETTRDMISAFGGYNHTMNCGENEFYMEKNMTSDYYPALAPRRKRRMLFRTGEIYGMYAKNGILLVEDGNLVYTDKEMNDWQIIGQLAKNPKVMCGMGAYVAIWPDKKIFNTNEYHDLQEKLKRKNHIGFMITVCCSVSYFCRCLDWS